MGSRLKNLILKNYIDLRLRWYKDDSPSLEIPSSLRNVKHLLLMVPPKQAKLEAPVKEFTSRLYEIFDNVNVSTFKEKSFRPIDGNWFGLPKKDYLEKFNKGKFDLIIDLNQQQDRLCAYICAFSGATLRLNFATGVYDHIYNFHIRTNENQEVIVRLEKILSYLHSFVK